MRSKVRGLSGWLLVPLLAVAGFAAPSGDQRLVTAVKEKNKEAARSLLRQRADVNARQADGATALHWAAHWDDLETADLLIRAGATVNTANDYGATPLWIACTNGKAAMVEKLLKAGADPNDALPTGQTVLMTCARAGSVDAVKLLVAGGANVNVNVKETEQGQTALMWAVAQKHADVAKVLIEHGADVQARSKGGFTPLLFATRVGDVESARVLLQAGANINETTPDGMTPLVLASASGQEPLGIFLLEKGADPNAKDKYGATALHYAMLKGISVLNGVVFANYVSHFYRPNLVELVKALLAHGANPNVRLEKTPRVGGRSSKTADGATPFLLAAATPDATVMRVLAAGGADPLLATTGNLTPLMAATGVSHGQDFTDEEKKEAFEAVKLAVELGNDVNAASEDGLTALHGAASNGADPVVQFLFDHGAKLDVKDKYQQTPLSISSGVRLPWIPYGDELGEIIRKSTAELLLKLGATPLTTAGYFTPVEGSEAYRFNQSQRYQGLSPERYEGITTQPK